MTHDASDKSPANFDPRIERYRDSVTQMSKWRFRHEIPLGPADEVGKLGRALQELDTRLDERIRGFERLTQVTSHVNAGFTLEEVLDQLYVSFKRIIPYTRIGYAAFSNDKKHLIARWARSEHKELHLQVGYKERLREQSSLFQLLKTGQPRILNDLQAYLQEHPKSHSTSLIVAEGVRSSLTCPLIVAEEPIGFLFFSSDRVDTYRGVHVELFLQIAAQLSVTIEKSRLYQQLVDLSEIKTQLLGTVAHDLRNPLGVVQGYMKLLLAGVLGGISDQQREILATADRNCERMLHLINDLLDTSAIESGRLTLNLTQIVPTEFFQECHKTHCLLAQRKDISLTLEVEDLPPQMMFDASRMAQVMDNLVTNALKFSASHTHVAVVARTENEFLVVSVEDQGPGISPSESEKIFEKFGQGSAKPTAGEKSIGLGLAIVKKIIDAHRGKIWVESEPGRGATFFFALPIKRLS